MLGAIYAAGAHRTGPLRMQANRSPAMETVNPPVLDGEHSWGSFVNGAARNPQLVPLNSARALAPPGSARAARLASTSELASTSQLSSSTVSGRAGVVRPLTSFAPASGRKLAPPGSARAARLASTSATDAVGVVCSTAGPTPAPVQPLAPSITVSGYGMSLSGYGMVQPLGGNALPENDARAFVDGDVQPLGENAWIAAPTDTWSSFVNGGSLDASHQPRAPRDPVRALAPPGSARAARLAAEAGWEAEASMESAVAEAAAVEAAVAEAQAQAVAEWQAEARAAAEAQAQAEAQAEARLGSDRSPFARVVQLGSHMDAGVC